MEIKIGKKYKANAIFRKQYSLKDEYVKLISISDSLVTIMCDGKALPVRMDFFLSNAIDLSKAIESIPRTVEEWKNEQIEKKENIVAPIPVVDNPIKPEPTPDPVEDNPTVPDPAPIPVPDPEPVPTPETEPKPVLDPQQEDSYPYNDGSDYPY